MSRDERASGPRRPLGGRIGTTLVALSPFVAVALFFLVGMQNAWAWSWIFFLLIPVTAIIVYGPRGRGDD
ncbi:hypothetical protein [Microbacterium rhizosphaerae]|uniref:DUF4175 domain-containing protein n=1 Tax=Microbacterium rhizosphaerae TaxID=1678237 RepID=A0ABZ0SSF0_9MICO|nr:hypothetical protein [Microbacterium rhizosphaerae]WPR90187.1 hypothetical protein SM116_02555 [Microbacterium rhizosphaerae]